MKTLNLYNISPYRLCEMSTCLVEDIGELKRCENWQEFFFIYLNLTIYCEKIWSSSLRRSSLSYSLNECHTTSEVETLVTRVKRRSNMAPNLCLHAQLNLLTSSLKIAAVLFVEICKKETQNVTSWNRLCSWLARKELQSNIQIANKMIANSYDARTANIIHIKI